MNNGFSFTLVEHSEHSTQILFAPENKDLVEHIFDSYDFEIIGATNRSFIINENFDDVFDDITDFEIDEEDNTLLLEEDEGFYTTPLDEVYEIQYLSTTDPSLLEGAVKRTLAVRGGKRKVIFKCGPGQMKIGRSCRRRPTAQLNKMKRRARISARKARKKRRLANRKRKLSMKRRAVLVRKKPSHHK
jgi:hypothetical protein